MSNSASTDTAPASPERPGLARPYEEEDLKNLKVKELWALMDSQPEVLAYALKNGFKKANATKLTLKAALLSAKFSFRTTKPRSEFVPGYGMHQPRIRRTRAHAAPMAALPPDPAGGLTPSLGPAPPHAPAPNDSARTVDPAFADGNERIGGGPIIASASAALTLYLKDLREPYYKDVPPEIMMITVPTQQDGSGRIRFVATYDIVATIFGARRRMSPQVKLSIEFSTNNVAARLLIYEWSGSSTGLTADDILIPQIFLPDDYNLMFYIEKAANATRLAEGQRTSTSDFRGASLAEIRHLTSHEDESPFMIRMRWLEGHLQLRDGYHDFVRSKNSNNTNTEIVKYWTFAVTFRDEFTKRRYPTSGERITNQDIYYVTGRGESWFREATEGFDLYRAHRDSPAVQSIMGDGIRHGAGNLLGLLKNIGKIAQDAVDAPTEEEVPNSEH
ncbi:hypothetical protein EV715DRAFT_289192 [Schizophyllum commune]